MIRKKTLPSVACRQRARRAPAIALVILAGAVVAQAGGAPSVRRTLVPDGRLTVPPYQIAGRAIEVTSSGLRLRVEPLDEEERAAYFRLRTRLGRDPLPGRDVYPSGLLVFEVSLQDNSGHDVTFSPALGTCWYTSDNEIRRVGSDTLFMLLRQGHEGDPNAEQAASDDLRAFHTDPIVLHDGERVTRLLVYEGLPARARSITLDLEQLLVGDAELRPIVHFAVRARPAAAGVTLGAPRTAAAPFKDAQ